MIKKHVVLSVLGILFCLSGIGVAADNSLAFQYDFSKAGSIAGGTVKDLSSNGNDGVITGDVHQIDGENGKTAFFDGTSGYIEIPKLKTWEMKHSVTFSAVVKFIDDGKVMGGYDSHDMVMAKDDYFVFGVWPTGAGAQRILYFNTYDGQTWFHGAASYSIVHPNTWMQLDVRITLLDKAKGKYLGEFYVDGSKVTEAPMENLFSQKNTNPFCVGRGFGVGCWLMHGYMASVSMYNKALSDREIIESAMDNPYIQNKPTVHLEASVLFAPRKGLATININGAYIGNMDAAKCSYQLQQTDKAGSQKLITKGLINRFANDRAKKDINIAKLHPGQYEFLISCISKDGQAFNEKIPWEKPDAQIWRDAKAGVSDQVISPWTPLKAQLKDKKLQVSCWGREYQIAGNGLAGDILTRDEHVLSKPIELVAEVNGKPALWKSNAPRVKSSTPAKIVFTGTAKSQDLQLSVDSYIEFDGMVLSKFTLKADKSAKVGKCSLRIPMNKENAKYSSFLYPDWGSYRGTLARAPKAIAFPYYMWIGDEDRGMCWFSERDMSEHLADPTKAVEIKTEGDEVVIQINLLDKAISLDKPLTFTVGFQATPVKPLPDKWRSFVQNNVALTWTWKELTRHFGYPEATNPDYYKSEVKKVHDAGKLFVPYTVLQMLSANSTEYKYFGDEWWSGGKDDTSADVISFVPRAAIYTVCPNAHDWIDVETYHIKQLVETYKIDGLYHDFSWPIRCTNTKHGCPEKGGYPILAMRELYRRTNTILRNQPRRTFEALHTGWALVCAPVCSFGDATLNGEEIGLTNGNGNYYKCFLSRKPEKATADSFLVDYIGRQFGPIPIFWRAPESNPEYNKPKYEQRMLSIMLLHDVLTSWGYWQEGYARMWKVLNDFGIDDAEFIPYWDKRKPITVSAFDPKPAEYSLSAPVLVSVYNCSGKRALVVIGNTSEVGIHASVNIDAKALGFTTPIRARDAYNPDINLLNGGSVDMDIPELEYKLLLVDELK